MNIDTTYDGSTNQRGNAMGLFTVQEIKRIVQQSESVQDAMQKATYEALLDNLDDDHIINMSSAFRLH